MSQAVNKTEPQRQNPSPLDEGYDVPEDGLDSGDSIDGGSDFENGLSSFQGQAPTRAEVLKLFERAHGRPDEKKVDQVLREVLNDLLAGDQQKAAEDYQAVPEDLLQPPEEDASTGDANGNKPSRTGGPPRLRKD
jgi:hypothetical protein